MKKFFVFLCLILICCVPVFAQYKSVSANINKQNKAENKTIPPSMSKQYKAEMEQIIEEAIPSAIIYIDDCVITAKNLHDKLMKTGYDDGEYTSLENINDICIPGAEMDLYVKLMKVTQEKYLGIKYIPIGTDDYYPIAEYIFPYLHDNNVNLEKFKEIGSYEDKQMAIVEKYIKHVQKLSPYSH